MHGDSLARARMAGAGGAARPNIAPSHPISTFMEEHKVILEKLDRLEELASDIQQAEGLDRFAEGMAELKDVARHLVEAESHHKREEEALFPALEAHGVEQPPHVMRMDHVVLRGKKQELYDLVRSPESTDFKELQSRVRQLATFLNAHLGAHIAKEDNILYRMALQILTDGEWEQVKRKCDEIGYCCFTPKAVR
jgi:DUF438 domain-containing protein